MKAKISETFTSVDAAWLRMDTPTNLAVITGVMSFRRPLDFERLKATVTYRMCSYPRFMQRVRPSVLPLGLPRWETDPDFSIDRHLHRVTLPAPADQRALQEFVGELMSHPLDRGRPLWEYFYVETSDGCSHLIGRLHHAIADGIALMQVLLSMTDTDPGAPPPPGQEGPTLELSRLARLIRPVLKTTRSLHRTWDSASGLAQDGMNALIHPSRWLDLAKVTTASTLSFYKLLLLPPDRKTIFRGSCGVPKAAAWSTTLSVEEVKAVGKTMGGTINDVLLSAITGALRRYLEEKSQPVAGLNFRAIVPVNLRAEDDVEQLGNRFGLVFLSLPVGVRDPLKRLVVLKRRMDAIKNSPDAVVALGILNFMGLTPLEIEKIIMMIFGVKGTAVMTNVPGPRQPLYLAGERLDSLMFWVPSPANLGMGVSIISYAGRIILGVATDACLVPDPEAIISHFQEEFAQLQRWGQRQPREAPVEAVSGGDGTGVESAPELISAAAPSRIEISGLESDAAPAFAGDFPGELIEPQGVEAFPVDFDLSATLTAQPEAAVQVEEASAGGDLIGRCHAVTRGGQPCKNRALSGSEFCRVHSKVKQLAG